MDTKARERSPDPTPSFISGVRQKSMNSGASARRSASAPAFSPAAPAIGHPPVRGDDVLCAAAHRTTTDDATPNVDRARIQHAAARIVGGEPAPDGVASHKILDVLGFPVFALGYGDLPDNGHPTHRE
jgi:hypothetical protein